MSPNDAISPPAHLTPESQELWRRICSESVIDTAAAEVLRTLCEARDRREQARRAIADSGAVIKDRFGVDKISPWVAIERDATLVMHRAFRLLGFDQEPRGGSGDQGLLFQ